MQTVRFIAAFLLSALSLCAQGLTGQISGTVQDPSGSAVPGAKVELTNTLTGQVRATASDQLGNYIVTQLLPGTYSLKIVAQGFKTYEQKDIVLTATERVAVRQIRLEMGDLTETISVTAASARLQTQSSERSGLITTSQIQEVPIRSRNFLATVRLLPGVVDTGDAEAPADGAGGTLRLNGNRRGMINTTFDGISSIDTGSMSGTHISPPLESIAEIKVLLVGYQAEYGRSSAGTIATVTRSGSREFHGGAYYFHRNEAFNANGYFNNRDGLPRPRYRFHNPGYFLGGPLLIPKLQKSRDKLFFFWSQEFLPRKNPTASARRTFPTALERAGDFSRTYDANSAVIPILDPLNNRSPFPGNVIPSGRIDRGGQKLLGLFPLPNTSDPRHTFNSVFQSTLEQPHHVEILRVDWNIAPSTTFYARGLLSHDADKGDFNCCVTGANFPHFPTQYVRDSNGIASTLIHTFSPTLVNEFTFGVNRRVQLVSAQSPEALAANDRVALGLDLPQFYPQINPLNLIPNATFGGVLSAPSLNIEARWPFFGTNNIWNISNNLSKVYGSHNFKTGFYLEITSRNAANNSSFNGTFNFARNVNNPLDSNYAFSNALLGSINSYTESDARPPVHARFSNFEWFVQDNWRVNSRLALDVGVRFYRIVPTWLAGDRISSFGLTDYDPSRAPKLIEPYRATPSAARTGRNPNTGAIVPEVLIGTIAPGGGDRYNGMRVADERILATPPVQVSPRLGFAWDVFGNGKTAFRGGAGMFPDRNLDNIVFQQANQVPQVNSFTVYYSTIRDLLRSPVTFSPANALSIQSEFRPTTVYNWNLGIQQDIGFSTVLEVSYVGSVGRRLTQRRSLNAVPYGTNFLPSSIDRTLTGNRPLPAVFLRPLRGYGEIQYAEWAGSSNYHSMQTHLTRRFRRDLMFGVAWTWSKAMDVADEWNTAVNPFLDFQMRNYGKAGFDRTHNLVLNYEYRLPSFRRDLRVLNWFTGDWQIAGITSFISGAPTAIGYSFVQAVDIVGGAGAGVDSRVILTGNPNLPRGERTRQRHFRTEVVRPPDAANFGIGNAPKDPIRGPGVSNWDISVFKNFRFSKDSERRIQFRCELYNAFNHTQFSGLDAAARFDAAGRQVNGRFGEYTAARDPRYMQVALKFYF